jgi:hypothetical protein
VEQFMEWDKTSAITYSMNYSCGHYARQVHNNAENSSIQCGLVAIQMGVDGWHSILSFPTVEDGEVFVDPTNCDKWAYVVVGEPYEAYPMAHIFSTGFQNTTVYPIVNWFEIYY